MRFARNRLRRCMVPHRPSPLLHSVRMCSAWYLHLWEQMMQQQPKGEPVSVSVSALQSIAGRGGPLPDGAVQSLWALFHSLETKSVDERIAFFRMLSQFGADIERVVKQQAKLQELVQQYDATSKMSQSSPPPHDDATRLPSSATASWKARQRHAQSSLVAAVKALNDAALPLCTRWFEQTTTLPHGMRYLMQLRGRLLEAIECVQDRAQLQSAAQGDRLSSTAAATDGSTRSSSSHHPVGNHESPATILVDLKSLDAMLLDAFRGFYAKQYLVLEELSWKATSPYVLERVIQSEQVHPFEHGLESLKLRIRDGYSVMSLHSYHHHDGNVSHNVCLDRHDRHMFALYHPAVAREPLISVQVAICAGIESSVDRILCRPTPLDEASGDENNNGGLVGRIGESRKENAQRGPSSPPSPSPPLLKPKDTVMFYSINNAQSSLRGIELGSTLIKRVAAEITTNASKFADRHTQRPHTISQYSTLSPIPGYMTWLKGEVAKLESGRPHRIFGDHLSKGQLEDLMNDLRTAFGGDEGSMSAEQLLFVLVELVTGDDNLGGSAYVQPARGASSPPPPPSSSPSSWFWKSELTVPLRRPLLRSVAWYLAKEKRRNRLLDPVGNFHVGNGAELHRINWLGNCTAKGSKESCGIMVNYRYDLDRLGENAWKYEVHSEVQLGNQIEELLAPPA